MNYGYGGYDEGEKEVEREESCEGSVVDGEAASDSLD